MKVRSRCWDLLFVSGDAARCESRKEVVVGDDQTKMTVGVDGDQQTARLLILTLWPVVECWNDSV